MTDINISPGITGHGAIRAPRVLTSTEQAVFRLLNDHEIPDILTHASGSPSQRLERLVRALAEFTDCATDVVVDQLQCNGFLVCASRPTSECGYSWPATPGDDIAADKRVLVVGAGPDGTDAVFCSQRCADAVIGVRS